MSDALLEAIYIRDVSRLAALLATGADPNEDGKPRYPIYDSGRQFPLLAAIGALEADKAIGPYGPEPAGSIDAIVLLLRHGAKVKGWDVNKEGDPLFLAVFNNHIEAVRLLLAHGADPNVRSGEGESPLPFCAEKGYLEMARLLLLCGANKTIHEGVMPSGMNALGYAATRLHVDMVRLLLTHGADPLVGDADDITVFERLEYARLPDDPASLERLREIRQLLGEPAAENSNG